MAYFLLKIIVLLSFLSHKMHTCQLVTRVMTPLSSPLLHDAELPSWKPPLELGHHVVGLDLGELEWRTDVGQSEELYTGVELILGSKVLCLFCFEICTAEGRGGEKGGSDFKTKHAEPFTFHPRNNFTPVYISVCKYVRK